MTEIVQEVLDRASAKGEELTEAVREFVEWELDRLRGSVPLCDYSQRLKRSDLCGRK
jgi:hypothetical protein